MPGGKMLDYRPATQPRQIKANSSSHMGEEVQAILLSSQYGDWAYPDLLLANHPSNSHLGRKPDECHARPPQFLTFVPASAWTMERPGWSIAPGRVRSAQP